MPRYCFKWTVTGSTIIEADTLEDARKQWDAVETTSEIVATACAVDVAEDGVWTESAPGCFDIKEAE